MLNTIEEKITLLDRAGVDHLVIVAFTKDFAAQTADMYCKEFIYKYFKPHTVIIGYDHRFGKNRVGDYHLLEEMGLELGFDVKEIDEEILNHVTISSTRIRTALLENDIDTADQFLGYPYFFEGAIVKGNQIGRTIGYPTANLQLNTEEKLIPANGVYAVSVYLRNKKDKKFYGMMNIGLRPTVDGTKKMIEVNIFDFNEDIYGEILQVHVHAFMRHEVKFDGLEALVAQLEADAIKAKAILNDKKHLL